MSNLLPDLSDFKKLQNRLQKVLGDDFIVEVDTEVASASGFTKEHFDLVVFFDREPIAAIEYKSLAYSIDLINRRDWLINNFKKVGIKYGILYFGKEDEFYLYIKNRYGLEKFSFDSIVKVIVEKREFGKKPLVDEVCVEILSCQHDRFEDQLSLCQHEIFDQLFTEQSLKFDEKRGVISFLPEYEDRFLKNLLSQNIQENLCRYTTLNSLFLIMKDKKHCMCSITCMNDKGEVSYVDSYVSYGVIATSYPIIEENNNCFILSCCEKEKIDDLTMWRLYADDGKGVCVEYEVNNAKVDNHQFFLAPVSYGQTPNCHYELDFIREIRNWRKDGWRFELKRWYIWKHFFKSYLFKDEKEVRLIFIPTDDDKENIKWIMDSTNHIASRICLFDLDDKRFPLNLKRSWIGPKCPEQTSNIDQFNYMNTKQKIFSVTNWKDATQPSKIKDYR